MGLKKENDFYLSQFESFLLAERRISKNSFTAYSKDILQLLDFLSDIHKSVEDCELADLKRFLKYLKRSDLKAKTIARKISSLKLFYQFLHDRYGLENIAKSLVFPKIEKILPSYLTESEITKLLKNANKDQSPKGIRNKVMLYLLYASGMRVSELINIRIDQIEFDTGFIKLEGKGGKERTVPLPKNILDLLLFYIENIRKKIIGKRGGDRFNYLFIGKYQNKIKPLTRQSLWIILKKMLIDAGITKNISPHSLRHSLATHLLKGGANIRSLQLLLGHEQITTVQIYTHLEKSHLREIYDRKHPRA